MFTDTFNRDLVKPNFPNRNDDARYWQSGLFFSASKWSLAQWRSEAYTNAMVFEGLTKYILGWDLDSTPLTAGKRLSIRSYSRSANDANKNFNFEVTE